MATKKVTKPSHSTEPEKTYPQRLAEVEQIGEQEEARKFTLSKEEFAELVNLHLSVDAFYKTIDDVNTELDVRDAASLFQPIQKWFGELEHRGDTWTDGLRHLRTRCDGDCRTKRRPCTRDARLS